MNIRSDAQIDREIMRTLIAYRRLVAYMCLDIQSQGGAHNG